jgi:hypothetical protein
MLFLSNSKISDGALMHVRRMERLEWLFLANTAVSDKGMLCLRGHPELRQLSLIGTLITEESAQSLKTMKHLTHLYVNHDTFSPKDVRYLHKTLPGLTIFDEFGNELGKLSD